MTIFLFDKITVTHHKVDQILSRNKRDSEEYMERDAFSGSSVEMIEFDQDLGATEENDTKVTDMIDAAALNQEIEDLQWGTLIPGQMLSYE